MLGTGQRISSDPPTLEVGPINSPIQAIFDYVQLNCVVFFLNQDSLKDQVCQEFFSQLFWLQPKRC